jgi:hypothetical protein
VDGSALSRPITKGVGALAAAGTKDLLWSSSGTRALRPLFLAGLIRATAEASVQRS